MTELKPMNHVLFQNNISFHADRVVLRIEYQKEDD